MILKEKKPTHSKDPKIRAGEEAEKQMSFYLQRAFAKRNDCFVLNDIRITYGDDVAQVDHLIVTPFGLFIVESKSINGKIIVNRRNEWSRTYNGKVEGMPSPILQAQAQGKVLRELLMANKESLLGKALFGSIQKGFVNCNISVYAAISDKGIIDREHEVKELFKADQICESITTELDSLKKRNSILSVNPVWEITLEETKRVADFLLKNHHPLVINRTIESDESQKKSKVVAKKTANQSHQEKSFVPKAGAICPQCNSLKLIKKSIQRADGTETDFLACSGYPKDCKAIFALKAVAKNNDIHNELKTSENELLKENDSCPRCKSGKLVKREAKTEFLGCSEYPKCRFTNYR